MATIRVVVGDIADQQADALVNAANSDLARGAGVCGAIFSGAGHGLAEEIKLRYPNGCPTGDAVETAAYGLPARHIIHAVAPIHRGGDDAERNQLASAYFNAIRAASEAGCRSIVFPSLGTGIYGWDIDQATPIARAAILSALEEHSEIAELTFCCFTGADAEVFRRVFSEELE